MSTIYIVTSGSYSDYHIDAVFDSKEKADMFVRYANMSGRSAEECYAEEWELNEYTDPVSRGLQYFRVEFAHLSAGDARVQKWVAGNDDSRIFTAADGRVWFQSYLWASDETAALKIANERRVQALLAAESQLKPSTDGDAQ